MEGRYSVLARLGKGYGWSTAPNAVRNFHLMICMRKVTGNGTRAYSLIPS